MIKNYFNKISKISEIKLNFLGFCLSILTDYVFSFFALHSNFGWIFFICHFPSLYLPIIITILICLHTKEHSVSISAYY